MGTQAKATKKHLVNAKNIILEAITTNHFNIADRLKQELNKIPLAAMKLIHEIAIYEAEYSYKQMKSLPNIEPLNLIEIQNTVDNLLVKTSLNNSKKLLENVYREFAHNKKKQYMQMIKDAQISDITKLKDNIVERTKGLFNTQNISLAKLAVVSTANSIRNRIILNANTR